MAFCDTLVSAGRSADHGPLAAFSADAAAKREATLPGVCPQTLHGVSHETPSKRTAPLFVVH